MYRQRWMSQRSVPTHRSPQHFDASPLDEAELRQPAGRRDLCFSSGPASSRSGRHLVEAQREHRATEQAKRLQRLRLEGDMNAVCLLFSEQATGSIEYPDPSMTFSAFAAAIHGRVTEVLGMLGPGDQGALL